MGEFNYHVLKMYSDVTQTVVRLEWWDLGWWCQQKETGQGINCGESGSAAHAKTVGKTPLVRAELASALRLKAFQFKHLAFGLSQELWVREDRSRFCGFQFTGCRRVDKVAQRALKKRKNAEANHGRKSIKCGKIGGKERENVGIYMKYQSVSAL